MSHLTGIFTKKQVLVLTQYRSSGTLRWGMPQIFKYQNLEKIDIITLQYLFCLKYISGASIIFFCHLVPTQNAMIQKLNSYLFLH